MVGKPKGAQRPLRCRTGCKCNPGYHQPTLLLTATGIDPTRPSHARLSDLSRRPPPATPTRPALPSCPALLYHVFSIALSAGSSHRIDKVDEEESAEEGAENDAGDATPRDAGAGRNGHGGLALQKLVWEIHFLHTLSEDSRRLGNLNRCLSSHCSEGLRKG